MKKSISTPCCCLRALRTRARVYTGHIHARMHAARTLHAMLPDDAQCDFPSVARTCSFVDPFTATRAISSSDVLAVSSLRVVPSSGRLFWGGRSTIDVLRRPRGDCIASTLPSPRITTNANGNAFARNIANTRACAALATTCSLQLSWFVSTTYLCVMGTDVGLISMGGH